MIINIEIFVEDGVYNRLKGIPPLVLACFTRRTVLEGHHPLYKLWS